MHPHCPLLGNFKTRGNQPTGRRGSLAPFTSHPGSSGNATSSSCDSYLSAYALRDSLTVSRPLTQAPLRFEQSAGVSISTDSQRQLCRMLGQSPPRFSVFCGLPFSLIHSPCYSQPYPALGRRGANSALPISRPPSQGRSPSGVHLAPILERWVVKGAHP